METKIKTQNDVRSCVALLTAAINAMCNATETQEVSEQFVTAKDLLIELFKFNVSRVDK